MAALDSALLASLRGASSKGRPYLVGHFATGPVTLTPQDCFGGIVTNEGAGAAVLVNLPAATVGMSVTFIQLAAFGLNAHPAATEIIRFSAAIAGDYVGGTIAIDNSYQLACVEDGEWLVTSYEGTIADE